jgi:hypothetical protein
MRARAGIAINEALPVAQTHALGAEALATTSADEPVGPAIADVLPAADPNSVASDWHVIKQSIDSIAALADDYDGAGSLAPNQDLLQSVRMFAATLEAATLAAPSAVAPTPIGGILMEWRISPQFYFEVEFPRPFVAEFMLMRDGFPTLHW